MVVARRSGESAAGPKRESWARRGESGCAEKVKPATGAPGGRASSSRRTRVSSVLTSRVGAGSAMARASWPSGSSLIATSRRVHARACDSRRRDEALERGVRDEEEGLERGERPLEVHALGEGRRRKVRLERARVDAARGRVELAADSRRAGWRLRPRAASRSRRSSGGPSGRASRRSRARGRASRAAAARGSATPRLRGRRSACRAVPPRRAPRAWTRRRRRARAAPPSPPRAGCRGEAEAPSPVPLRRERGRVPLFPLGGEGQGEASAGCPSRSR